MSARATAQDYLDEAEERKEEPVQSNETPQWPQGPAIGAESAVLMDADTGVLLYAKNIDEHLFPASTTKLMTCLVAIEIDDGVQVGDDFFRPFRLVCRCRWVGIGN